MKIDPVLYSMVFAVVGGACVACSAPEQGASAVEGVGAGASSTASPGNGQAGNSLNISPTPEDSGAMGGNASVQCNGKFTGYLRDFAVGQGPSGSPLDPNAMPPIAVAVAGVNYASSPDFEVADARLHPATATGKRFVPDPGMVQATLGADGTPTYAGPAQGTVTTTGPQNFQTWFHDTPKVNMGENLTLQFQPDPAKPNDPNAYYFDSSSMGCGSARCAGFFPIDNQLLLNEGNAHNYHMTFELHLEFKYQAGQVFTFKGDDDIWVYINNQLDLDLGGIHNEATGQINLDSLGLSVGQTYPLAFFWCERHVTGSNLRIETSLEVTSCGTPMIK